MIGCTLNCNQNKSPLFSLLCHSNRESNWDLALGYHLSQCLTGSSASFSQRITFTEGCRTFLGRKIRYGQGQKRILPKSKLVNQWAYQGYSQEDSKAAAPPGSPLGDLGTAVLPKVPRKLTVFFLHKWKGLEDVTAHEPLPLSIRECF